MGLEKKMIEAAFVLHISKNRTWKTFKEFFVHDFYWPTSLPNLFFSDLD